MNAKEFLNNKGDGASPYADVIWNFNTISNEWLADLLEEYAKFKILNLHIVSGSFSAEKLKEAYTDGFSDSRYDFDSENYR